MCVKTIKGHFVLAGLYLITFYIENTFIALLWIADWQRWVDPFTYCSHSLSCDPNPLLLRDVSKAKKKHFSLSRFQNLTISIWTWTGLFISAPTRTTRMSTFAFLRRRFLLTSSITWRCSSGSSSLARSSSWRWMAWHQGQRWTNREAGDSGRDGYRIKGNVEKFFPLFMFSDSQNGSTRVIWPGSMTLFLSWIYVCVWLSGSVMKDGTQAPVTAITLPKCFHYYYLFVMEWLDF